MDNQFGLLRKRRFLPFFVAQLLGAFNDNLYKSAAMILLVFAAAHSGGDPDLLANIGAGVFILPFFMFSAMGGQLADRFDKASFIRVVKLAEVIVALASAYALFSGNGWLMIGALFLFGTQAAFFSPAKYSIIPQHLRQHELVGGNALVETGTFVAILIGTMVGGALAGSDTGLWLLTILLLAAAIFGYFASRLIPSAPSRTPNAPIEWNFAKEFTTVMQIALERRTVFLAILGISWFWLLGSAYLTQIPHYTLAELHGDNTVVTLLLASFSAGIALGSLLCERLSGQRIEIGLVPIGSTGLSLIAFDVFALDIGTSGPLQTWWQFLSTPNGPRLCLDFALMGAFGGIFVVPLNAMVQIRTPEAVRARMLAVNNILNALFMAVAAVFAIIMLSIVQISIHQLFLLLALMNLVVAWFIYHQVPEFTARFLVWGLSHTMYRVKHAGLDYIPERGAAIIVCNHVSYVDALLLAGAVRRPIRFIMYKPIYELPILKFVFDVGRAIPIISQYQDKEAYDHAFREIKSGLEAGDLLCIFPEGALTRDGEIAEFRTGIERILQQTPVPVIPMALRGLWGSWFSYHDGDPFKRRPKRFWSRVEIVAGPPISPELATAPTLYARVAALRGDLR